MPRNPKNISRAYVPERVAFERPVDMSWFYNQTKWRKVSKAFRSANPVCQCESCAKNDIAKPAQVCDHKRGLKYLLDNNLDPYDYKELQSMSRECHNKKSGKEKGGYGVKSL